MPDMQKVFDDAQGYKVRLDALNAAAKVYEGTRYNETYIIGMAKSFEGYLRGANT